MIRVNRRVLMSRLDSRDPLLNLVERCVGKTTGAILTALGESYAKPGQWVQVTDPDLKTEFLADHLVNEVKSWVHALQFEFIEVRRESRPGERHGPTAPNYRPQYPCVFIRNTFAEVLS